MAGHSKYANIKHRKAAQDNKRTKHFTKITRLVFVAAKHGGSNVENNPALRLAITKAKHYNLPKDRIDKAIKNATSTSVSENYEEMHYEGYGANGVAIIVHALTDNKNRTASEVRSIFSKFNGNLGIDGSVSHIFNIVGMLKYSNVDNEKIFNVATEANALDVVSNQEININNEEENITKVLCIAKELNSTRMQLTKEFNDPVESSIVWMPQTFVELPLDKADIIIKMINALEDIDDVQSVDSNLKIVE
ncbi:putative transcriptional regulatory protein CAXCGENOME1_v1_310037 [Candidatus Xenohaliotis californiensis]|uniref:Probable transcriptional regulatory protein CAXC1_310037 n=1 Tax=Candidatus Xenohaliotis californiensis TaxID=84677 RepID=A0ABM9N8E1_9RICK|nr:putative transcriptional regulatory protein CAXCGENOME1_v1_310037 [Candidatus Xenohaliotis californiensis]